MMKNCFEHFADHVEDPQDVSLFALPEFGVAFSPRHGDVFCMRACNFYHCTRALKKNNLLGLPFFQKGSLFPQLKRLMDAPMDGVIKHSIPKKRKAPAKTLFEKRADFEVKKEIYERNLKAGKVCLKNI